MLRKMFHRAGRWYDHREVSCEFRHQTFRGTNERPIEYAYVFRWLNALQPRTVLDAGTGQSALPALVRTCGHVVTAIDNITDYWPDGLHNRHWLVLHDDLRRPRLTKTVDLTLCISVIEHITDHAAAMSGLATLVRPGGHLILSCPYSERDGHRNVYEEVDSYGQGQPYICRQSTRADLDIWLRAGFVVRDQEWWRCFDHVYWSCGSLVRPPVAVGPPDLHQLTCLLLERT